ncbi:MAG: substrate-binding domain-containing protein [Clostridia bacterium]|nr:substrate-binding domain-containing protein [Clostridia bacterium]
MIKRNSQTPLYVQLANLLRQKIALGEISVGDKLPSESEMIKEYSLGRLTIRDALSILANEGLIEKHHGKGTFCKACVSEPRYRVDVLLNLKDMYFVHHYLQAICGELEKSDVSVVLHDTKNDTQKICNCLEKIDSEGTSGVIFQPASCGGMAPDNFLNVLEKFNKKNVPYIMIDSVYENATPSFVIMNEIESGKIAANYLKSLGHKKLCMITKEGNSDSDLRLKGFKEEFESEIYVINHSGNLENDITKMIKENENITGIFCYNDSVAKDLYKVFENRGISVPEDMSVIGVDDTVIASALSLTSVVHPKKHLAKDAAKALMQIIKGKETWPYKKIFEPSLKIRKSCKKI